MAKAKPEKAGYLFSRTNLEEAAPRAEERLRALDAESKSESITKVPLDLIDPSPFQGRRVFDSAAIQTLANDIKQNGIINPVTLMRAGIRYQLIAGDRRVRAARIAGFTEVSAVILEDVDEVKARLIAKAENHQREDFSAFEQALETSDLDRYLESIGDKQKQRDLAKLIGGNVTTVNQQLKIARNLTPAILNRARLTEGQVCELSHEVLIRIALLPDTERPRALRESYRLHQLRKRAKGASTADAPQRKFVGEIRDAWTRLWETGGFSLNIKKPLKDLEPKKAGSYMQKILPGLIGLARRASDENRALASWSHDQGQVLVLRSIEDMSSEERMQAKQELEAVLQSLNT